MAPYVIAGLRLRVRGSKLLIVVFFRAWPGTTPSLREVLARCAVAAGGGGPGAGGPATAAGTGGGNGNNNGGGNSGGNNGGSNNGKQAVGTVTGIVPVGGQVAGAAAFEGQAVGRQDVINTEANGKIIFSLGQQVPFCQVETASEVQVTPGGATLVEVRKGTALCRTSTNGQLKQFVAGGTVIRRRSGVPRQVGRHAATMQVVRASSGWRTCSTAAWLGANQQAQSGSGDR